MWVLWVSDEKCNRRGVTTLGEECNFGMRVEYTETLRWHKLGVAGDHGRLNGWRFGEGCICTEHIDRVWGRCEGEEQGENVGYPQMLISL